MRRTLYLATIAGVLILTGCGGGQPAAINTVAPTASSKAPRSVANLTAFLAEVGKLDVAKANPWERANEICDWFDQGDSLAQIERAEADVIRRDWPSALDPYGRPSIDQYNVQLLIWAATKYTCPEHVNKLTA
ncbi:Uncharacterised protein [Mycobacteroides abscessus subsp. abscessus]|nr:hypothetical protein [Mycobacteroides abscessus]SHP05994.1 Uncharacterised protein [Mycobacteroides abscessus subsp. abscessus]SKE78902.1 Uncharacterised protein [Mycobacteroides abscessus subsp. massiliense]SHP11472.1 Uncharacterised protein [Mycobacteroides abscessus subsp. abscessus]SHP40118.1 Uncharacterised protein [Mycobacteroides abscessus subsp. abscessus]